MSPKNIYTKVGNVASPKRKALFVLAVLLCVALVALVAVFEAHKEQSKQSPSNFDAAKVHALTSKPDNCGAVLTELKDVQPDPKQVEASTSLLAYRSTCYMIKYQYPEALRDSEQLKQYYQKQNNTERVAIVDKQITLLKYRIDNHVSGKVKPRTHSDPVSPEFAKQLEEEN